MRTNRMAYGWRLRYRYLRTRRFRRYVRRKSYRRTYRRRVVRFRYKRPKYMRSVYIKAQAYITFVPSSSNYTLVIAPTLKTFLELQPFVPLFESYQLMRVSVSVIPTANVSNVQVPAPTYACAPYHKPLAGGQQINVQTILTLDRGKQYAGTRKSFRTYVPAVDQVIEGTSGPVPIMVKYRPIITPNKTSDGMDIPQYCAIYAFNVATSQYRIK